MKPYLTEEDWEEMSENPMADRLYSVGFIHGCATMLFGVLLGEALIWFKLYLQG